MLLFLIQFVESRSFLALEEDLNTVYGAVFDHKGETPGLGAEINQAFFQEPFIGKTIFDGEKLTSAAYIATFWGFLGMTLIGAGFHIQNRMLGSKISSEAGASMFSLFWFVLTLLFVNISLTTT